MLGLTQVLEPPLPVLPRMEAPPRARPLPLPLPLGPPRFVGIVAVGYW